MVSAPYLRETSSFSNSFFGQLEVWELPMLELILVRRARPMPIGFRLVWFTFAGITIVPAATPSRMNSGERYSEAATAAISGVTTPCFAASIWVLSAFMLDSLSLLSRKASIGSSLRRHDPDQVSCAVPGAYGSKPYGFLSARLGGLPCSGIC